MIVSKDQIPSFIPTKNPKLIILGTMASVAAREVGDNKSHFDSFYYHNKNNHFWRILQLVFEPKSPPQKFENSREKKEFLNKWQIAMANIISEIHISDTYAQDPSDKVIFESFQKGQVNFKKVSPKFKSILKTTPIFFTCSQNKYIDQLLRAYFKANKLNIDVDKSVKFLMTPTRCNPMERSFGWKLRMAEMGVETKKITIP